MKQNFRVKGVSWWPEELPADGEYLTALETLERASWKADYVITHCAPTSISQMIDRDYQPDALTDFLETVNQRLDFHHWIFGHYHDNRKLTEKHILLWEQMVRVI